MYVLILVGISFVSLKLLQPRQDLGRGIRFPYIAREEQDIEPRPVLYGVVHNEKDMIFRLSLGFRPWILFCELIC